MVSTRWRRAHSPLELVLRSLLGKINMAANFVIPRDIVVTELPERRSRSSFSEGRKPEQRPGTFFLASV
jgi:hypothetical protein